MGVAICDVLLQKHNPKGFAAVCSAFPDRATSSASSSAWKVDRGDSSPVLVKRKSSRRRSPSPIRASAFEAAANSVRAVTAAYGSTRARTQCADRSSLSTADGRRASRGIRQSGIANVISSPVSLSSKGKRGSKQQHFVDHGLSFFS